MRRRRSSTISTSTVSARPRARVPAFSSAPRLTARILQVLTGIGLWQSRPRSHHAASNKPFDEDYSPVSGSSHFVQALQVDVASSSGSSASSFRVYYTPPSTTPGNADDDDEESPVVFVCHHGAGYSAMSFALLASEIVRESSGRAGVMAIDCRGHGTHYRSCYECTLTILVREDCCE